MIPVRKAHVAWLGALALATFLFFGKRARSQEAVGSGVTLRAAAGCDASFVAAVASILRVERSSAPATPAPSGLLVQITLTCDGTRVKGAAFVEAGNDSIRETNLEDVPPTLRSRVVALALAEQVGELTSAKPPVAPPLVTSPDASATLSPERASVSLGAFGEASTFSSSRLWLLGAGLAFASTYRGLGAGLDLAIGSASDSYVQGTASALLIAARPHVSWGGRWGRAGGEVGCGYALGSATVRGYAPSPGTPVGTARGLWTAPYLFVEGQIFVTGPLALRARTTAGWVTSPVYGDVSGATGIALAGAWLSGELGVSLTL